jgi:hypothetical protein
MLLEAPKLARYGITNFSWGHEARGRSETRSLPRRTGSTAAVRGDIFGAPTPLNRRVFRREQFPPRRVGRAATSGGSSRDLVKCDGAWPWLTVL